MSTSLAPIGLSTYSRLQHLQQAIEALQKNTLASQSELFVFSDAAKPGDEDKVDAVRRYLRTVNGFKAVNVLERTENNRIANSRGGIRMLLDKYGKIIFLEEDVVTAPGFLRFMNGALDFYKDDPSIGSVTGYKLPIKIPALYKHDVFILPGVAGWGVGFWKETFYFEKEITKKAYLEAKKNPEICKMLKLSDIYYYKLLPQEIRGEINAGDVRATFHQIVNRQFTLYPVESLTQNIGFDGSGEHCGTSTEYDVDLYRGEKEFKFISNPVLNDLIVNEYKRFQPMDVLRIIKSHVKGMLSLSK